MTRTVLAGVVVMTMLTAGAPAKAVGQVQSWQEVQIADIEGMRDKFRALAGAFDAGQYDWTPMEGVRSVREVLGLAIAEANLFPTAWGYDPGPTAARGFEAELARAAALSKPDMIREIDTSFAYLLRIVGEMSDEKRMSDGSYFGTPMPVHASVATAMADMHEHLGQLIAYARTNRVVPPWSAGNG